MLPSLASWTPGTEPAAFDAEGLTLAARRVREPCLVVQDTSSGRVGVGFAGSAASTGPCALVAALPPLWPEHLGNRAFLEAHGCRFPYVVGEMAQGITTARMVVAAHEAGLLGFFGAAGLPTTKIEAAIDEIQAGVARHAGKDPDCWGVNLIHSPSEPELEDAVVDLYLRRGVRRVSASAYMALTPMLVRFAASGLWQDCGGRIHRRSFVFGKISRPETARAFLRPPPAAMLEALVREGKLTAEEARLAARIPVATDLTVEADSGGHTDNQALPAVFPTVKQLALSCAAELALDAPVRVGAAGGLGTPDAVAAAFAMGASYVLTGSVNQSAVESGLSLRGRQLLAQARLGDTTMAPAADMFELGVKVQVLKRGTLFAQRAHKLYELYRAFPSLEAIPAVERGKLEREILGGSVEELWASTRAFFERRDPRQIEQAEADAKHKMALVFRAYLGQASKWAITGDDKRALDFQIWSGPALGAFNAWVQGSFLEPLEARTVGQIAWNLLEGAAVVTRAAALRAAGCPLPDQAFLFTPRPLALVDEAGASNERTPRGPATSGSYSASARELQ
ncbi:MAG: PfaD family polyunsaturated fatty acid/polyketide biosynthesis protein [Deltaproteobacteria bacterium]|nr:PfaD family polyunsaturated fatty acid/polyketide biosynthesis protein [Deltaproteobacteria bacterium]